MSGKSKKNEEEVKEEQTQPEQGISSFSLLDTPKLNVEETNLEEENNPSASVTSDQKPEREGELTSEGTEEPETQEEQVTEEAEKPEEAPTEEKAESKKGPLSSEEVKQWLKDVRPDITKEVVKSSGPNFRLFLLALGVFLLIGAVVGGIFYYKSKVSKVTTVTENEEVTPTATAAPSPPAQQQGEVDLSKYSVNILNGSGIPGEASRVGETLKAQGFKEIKTGNADSYDFTTTTVTLKAEVPEAVYAKIKEALSNNYEVVKSSTPLDKTSTYDIKITVGTKK